MKELEGVEKELCQALQRYNELFEEKSKLESLQEKRIFEISVEYERLKGEYATQKHETAIQKETLVKAQNEFKELQHTYFESQKEIASLQTHYQDCILTKLKLDQEIKVLKEENASQKASLIEAKHLCNSLEDQIELLKKENLEQKTTFHQENENLKLSLEAVSKSLEDTLLEKVKLTELLENERANLELNKNENHVLRSSQEELKKQITLLNAKLHNEVEQNEKYSLRIDQFEDLLHLKENRIQELQEYESVYHKTHDAKLKLEEMIREERAQILTLQNERDRLIRLFHEKEALITIQDEKIETLQAQIRKEEIERQILYQELESSQKEAEKRGNHIVSLSEENRYLQSQYQQASDNVEDLQTKFAALEDTHLQLDVNFQACLGRIVEKEKEIDEARLLIIQLNEEKSSLQESLKEKSTCIKSFEAELAMTKQVLIKGMRDAKELESSFHDMIREKASLIARYHQVCHVLEKQQEEGKSILEKLNCLEEEKLALDANNNRLTLEIDALHLSEASLCEKISRLEKDNEELYQGKIHLESNREQLIKDKQLLEESLDNQQNTLQELRQFLEISKLERDALIEKCNLLEHKGQEDSLLMTQMMEERDKRVKELEDLVASLHEKEEKLRLAEEDLEILREEKIGLISQVGQLEEAKQISFRDYANLKTKHDELFLQLDGKTLALVQTFNERDALQQRLQTSQSELEDRENRIKMAQQHLAKKVKEVAVLSEKIEEQKFQILELQNHMSQQQGKINELKATLDLQQQQETKLQELLNEGIKSAESQIAKWEEKYFKMHEKWQECDMKNRELKKLEEKYIQLQSLLANLGNFISAPIGNAAPIHNSNIGGEVQQQSEVEKNETVNSFFEEQEAANAEPASRGDSFRANKTDLFDLPKSLSKMKDSLFDTN